MLKLGISGKYGVSRSGRHSSPGSGASGGFTLVELLIVIGIIGILSTLLLGGLSYAQKRAKMAMAKSEIESFKAALAQYDTDRSLYPHHPRGTISVNAQGSPAFFSNDVAWLYVGLSDTNPKAGAGNAKPYLDWKPDQVGVACAGYYAYNFQAMNNTNSAPPPLPLRLQSSDQQAQLQDPNQQLLNIPTVGTGGENVAWVYLDPWGNPFVYWEWNSIPDMVRSNMIQNPSPAQSQETTDSGPTSHLLRPHGQDFDIYSFGGNGVNEFGENDDPNSWNQQS